MEIDIDRTKAAVAVAVTVAVVVGVGYAYIAGVGPLEEDPTAGLEEPPETESTYSFGEVPETGTEGGDGDGQAQEDAGTETETEAEELNQQQEALRDGTEDADGTDTEASGGEGDGKSGDGTDDTDESGIGTESNGDGTTGDGDVDGDDYDTDDDGTEDEDHRSGSPVVTNTERSGQPFVPELENMEECGETCREATVALQNKMSVDAENVVVYVRLYAGDSTNSEDVIWGENRELGTLGAGEVYRETETVDLTPQQANKVRETEGVVTAKATIESDQATATFVERDNVE